MQHVLLVHRFYAPDVTTYSQMLALIAGQLRADGLEVSVFSTLPSYNNVYRGPKLPKKRMEDGVTVYRADIPGGGTSVGRLLGGIVFGVRLIGHILRSGRKYDTLMVSTAPPVLMGLFGLAAARISKARLVYHCMDLYPEIAIASGHSNEGILSKLSGLLDSFTISHAARTVVLSQDMRATIERRGVSTNRVVVQNNFALEPERSSASVAMPEALKPTGRFRLLFAGNIGLFQGLDTLLEAVAQDDHTDTELVFLGAGAAKAQLERQSQQLNLDDRVTFVDHHPLDVAMRAMSESDLAIVSLAPGLIYSAFPSKTLMYLQMGARILAIVEPESELGKLITENKLGAVATPGNVAAISRAIAAERNRELRTDDCERAREIADREFATTRVLPRWSAIFSNLESP